MIQNYIIIKTNEGLGLPSSPKIHIMRGDISRDKLIDLYRSVAMKGAYVHPHCCEGFGMPVIEALACGCHCGTTGYSGVRDFIIDREWCRPFKYKLEESKLTRNIYTYNKMPVWAMPNANDVKYWMSGIYQKFKKIKTYEPTKFHMGYLDRLKEEFNWKTVMVNFMKKVKQK